MQLVALASTALFAASALAEASPDLLTNGLKLLKTANDRCDTESPMVKIINTCSYPVHLWSVLKTEVCGGPGIILQQGDFYQENYRPAVNETGISIKLSKSEVCNCKETDITQVEYFIETVGAKRSGVLGNFHDISFVDCQNFGGKCPGRDGFYLKTGNVNGQWMSSANNKECPILDCGSKAECAKVAYILPDDIQTKWCQTKANMEFHVCGRQSDNKDAASSNAPVSYAAPASSSPAASSSAAAYTPPVVTPSTVVTPSAIQTPPPANVQVVYTTAIAYETVVVYANEKRSHLAHHAHRHQHFHA